MIQINRIYGIIFSLLLFLPASSFLLFRSFLLLILVSTLTVHTLKSKINLQLFFVLIFSLLFLSIFLLYSLYINDNNLNVDAYSKYTVFIVVLISFIHIYKSRKLSIVNILKLTFYTILIYNLIKILLILSVPFGIFSARELTDFVRSLGVIVAGGYWTEDATFARLSFGNDMVNPFALFFIFILNNKYKIFSNNFIAFFALFSFLSALVSFTRSIWIIEVIVLFYYYIIIRKNYFSLLIIFVFFLIFISHLYFNYFHLIETFYIRLFDSPSLDMKALQSLELINKFYDNFMFGNGISAFLPDLIRSIEQKYIYEVQIYAILMQFGLFGILFFIVFFLWIVSKNFRFMNFPIYFMYLLWLSTGLTNPFLFILTSTYIYLFFYIILNEDI